MKRAGVDIETAAAAATGAALAAALTFAALTATASPPDLSHRLAAANAILDETQRSATKGRPGSTYPPAPLCRDELGDAGGHLRQRVETAVTRAGLKLTALDVAAGAEGGAHLAMVAFGLRGEGTNAAVTALLQDLSAGGPAILVTALELRSKSAMVNLKLSGHVFCQTSARR